MVSDCVMYEVIMFLYHFSKGEVLTLGRESTTVCKVTWRMLSRRNTSCRSRSSISMMTLPASKTIIPVRFPSRRGRSLNWNKSSEMQIIKSKVYVSNKYFGRIVQKSSARSLEKCEKFGKKVPNS